MNWFERYGIVGMFFLVMVGLWFFFLFPNSHTLLTQSNGNAILAKYIVGFCGLSFLPIGYLIVILTQLYYYHKNYWQKIHCEHWDNLSEKTKNIIESEENKNNNILSESDKKNEAKMEALITYYDRFHVCATEKNKFASGFSTKRYDVIAINRSLKAAAYISFLCALFLKLVHLRFAPPEISELSAYQPFFLWLAAVVIFIIFIFVILFYLQRSSSVLENQIIEIGKRIHRNIDVKQSRGSDSSASSVAGSDETGETSLGR